MKHSLFIIAALLVSHAHAQTPTPADDNYQRDTEYSTQTTIDQTGDKKVITQKSGKVNPRQGEPKVGEIYQGDVDRVNERVKAHRFSSFGFGPFYSTKQDNNGLMYGLSFGHSWEAAVHGEIRFTVLGAANSNSQYLSGNLGYAYLPLATDISPVVGAELGGGMARFKKDGEKKTEGGFGGGLFAGVRFNRTGDTQLELLGSYDVLFKDDSPGIVGLQLKLLY